METLNDLDRQHAAAISRDAIGLMNELGVPLIPTNYTVWFAYVLGRSPELRRTIDLLLSNKRPFDKALNKELYKTFLSSNNLLEAGQNITEELTTVLLNVKGDVSGALAATSSQAETFKVLRSQIGLDTLGDIVTIMSRELGLATSRAATLERKLASALAELDFLRASLDAAEQKSKTDALTGLANRRALEAYMKQQRSGASRASPLSVFLVDIDYFKQFNDTHGHQIGDQVLQVVSRCLLDEIGENALAARYGGEEFMCLLPDQDVLSCTGIAERIRDKIAKAQIIKRTSGERVGKITVSIGVTQWSTGETYEVLFERCDKALYKAKQTGRNCIVVA